MRFISIIATVCIFIELWHIVYYTFLYEKYFKHAEDVIMWAQSYDKSYKYFLEFGNYYINNPELQEVLGCSELLDTVKSLNRTGASSVVKNKILSICTMKEFLLFLFQQSIELIYLLLIVNLATIMPGISGIILLIILLSLSTFQKHYNKDKNSIYLNIDSLFCIAMFAMFAFSFFNCY